MFVTVMVVFEGILSVLPGKYSVSDIRDRWQGSIFYCLVFICFLQNVLIGFHYRYLTLGGLLIYWLVRDQWRINAVCIEIEFKVG